MPPEEETQPTPPTPPTPPAGDTITIEVPESETPPTPPPSSKRGAQPPEPRAYTPEEIEAIRAEERAKLSREMTKAQEDRTELARLRQVEEERQKAEEKTRKEAERAAKKKEEEELELRDLITRKDQEWEERLAAERAEREKMMAVLDQERRFSALQNYLNQRMATEAQYIAPQLLDLVAGNTEEEIDASIEDMKRRSALISEDVLTNLRQGQSLQRTVGVTQPPIGPTEMQTATRTLSPDDIKAMSPEEYAAVREPLMKAAYQQYRQ